MTTKRFLIRGLLISWLPTALSAAALPLELQPGDHVAIVGSGLADRQQHHGWLEALIHRAHPEHDLTVRNLGFATDEFDLRPRSDEVPTTEYFLSMRQGDTVVRVGGTEVTYKAGTDFGADVMLAYWGFNESFRGPEGLDDFKQRLDRYLRQQQEARYNGESAPRLVLLSPIAHEDLDHPDFPDGEENNAKLALYTEAMAEVAAARGVPFIDLFSASRALYAETEEPLTINGIHLSEEGDRLLAPLQFEALFGRHAEASAEDGELERLRQAVIEKNTEWHHRYRTVDQYNIYGSRSRIAYEGVTNAEILGAEMAQRDVKTANRDRRVWAVARGGDLTVTDDNLPPVPPTPTNRPDTSEYLNGEEAIAHLRLPEGLKIELVACEQQFPELVNPVQMAFDTRGRLWVAVWPNYPETTPTTDVFDKLLVIDLDPETGKATKVTTFLDGLNCPTGFQFYKDGVLVMQSPDLWWVRDTNGDGKADWKERVLHGLDAADSHHETNSMCLEPGGAVYLSDGIFHRSSVETIDGPVRNRDGAIYRFEPNTFRFTRHIPYGLLNPHGRVFDHWGNDLVTDATGNNNYFGPAFSGHLDSGAHPNMRTFWDRPSRPCSGTAILSSRHFPDDWQGEFLNANVISIQGVFRARLTDEGSGIRGETLEHLVTTDIAANPNFRPSGITVAPDGSLYLMDWSQMLIGHLQHHLRDPNRDHQHGRLYRITHEERPLLEPKPIHGEPIEHLLDLLKEPEIDVRMRAKIELGNHDPQEVTSAAKAWVAALDPDLPELEHHVLEGLWVHQWHNVVDLELLERVLASPEPRARAQAVRVLGYWLDRVPDALERVKAAAADEAPRVRLEAVRVASFFRQWEAADAALAALQHPTDYYLDYCLTQTMRQLRPWWSEALAAGEPIAAGNPAGAAYLLDGMSTAELVNLPATAATRGAILVREDATPAQRAEVLAALAEADGLEPVDALLEALAPLAPAGGAAAESLAELLVSQDPAPLAGRRERLRELMADAGSASVRRLLLAAHLVADGSTEPAWPQAAASPEALADWLAAIRLLPEGRLRASAFDRVRPLLAALPEGLAASLGESGSPIGRYVRISLPRRGTLTLAEVQVFSEGREVSRSGRARQSSTAHDGVASRAIDGNTDGRYASGSQTHTQENENRPWWEVDLRGSMPIDSVIVWNRTDDGGRYVERLEGFDLIVLDQDREEVFRRSGNPAPAESATLELEADPAGELRREALRTLVATGVEPSRIASELFTRLEEGDLAPAAARGLLDLPRGAWPAARASAAMRGLLGAAEETAVEARTGAEFTDLLSFASELGALLPEAEAAEARTTLAALGVPRHVVRAVPEQLRFDVTRIVVAPGRPFELVVENPDQIPHNLLLVTPGSRQAVSESVIADPPTKTDSQGRAYVPEGDARVLAATRMLEAGESETLFLSAPSEPGSYEYVCTFPGHWTIMWGTLVVTEDPEAYLRENPEGE